MDRIIAASWSAELKLALAILIGIALAIGIAVFLKYLIEL
jgi:capsular polysaccharide biosynthesis protein